MCCPVDECTTIKHLYTSFRADPGLSVHAVRHLKACRLCQDLKYNKFNTEQSNLPQHR